MRRARKIADAIGARTSKATRRASPQLVPASSPHGCAAVGPPLDAISTQPPELVPVSRSPEETPRNDKCADQFLPRVPGVRDLEKDDAEEPAKEREDYSSDRKQDHSRGITPAWTSHLR